MLSIWKKYVTRFENEKRIFVNESNILIYTIHSHVPYTKLFNLKMKMGDKLFNGGIEKREKKLRLNDGAQKIISKNVMILLKLIFSTPSYTSMKQNRFKVHRINKNKTKQCTRKIHSTLTLIFFWIGYVFIYRIESTKCEARKKGPNGEEEREKLKVS